MFKIGPIPSDEGNANAYFVMPGKNGSTTYMAADDHGAMEQILSDYSADELECEPELGAAASKFGIRAVELNPHRAHLIGGMAFDMALGDHMKGVLRESAVYGFALAAGAFWRAEPWRQRAVRGPLEVRLSGAVNDSLTAMLLGEGAKYGMSMYQGLESIEWLLAQAEAGLHEEAARADSLIVTFDDQPQFATDAMRRAYGLPRVPVATKMSAGEGTPLTDLDLLSIGASLKAVSYLTDQVSRSTGKIVAEDLEVEAVVEIMRPQ